jgi:hypothetical protein
MLTPLLLFKLYDRLISVTVKLSSIQQSFRGTYLICEKNAETSFGCAVKLFKYQPRRAARRALSLFLLLLFFSSLFI